MEFKIKTMPRNKPDIEGIKRFLDYRKKKLSYREIGAIMKKDTKTLWRWSQFIKAGVLVGKKKTEKLSTS